MKEIKAESDSADDLFFIFIICMDYLITLMITKR